uniref:Glutathione S-transferase n=1 Tax=Alexandrium monilatum TaxID=311494 RepID=A0A7S4VU61_9DINO|mmetsp:Transcript_54478/g.162273  ORF Transcript_54478/g.162273 Transcript_54478/m.162273 type:complete len:228 (+) Transcript_54478:44-727(+)
MATPGSSITLYHCESARSFRVLWTLHELGIKGYRLVTMPFPPRFLAEGYAKINVLGTIPYFVDGETKMTESCGAPMYLVEKYGPTTLKVSPDEPDFGAYLNWITHADATITFPQTVFLRFVVQEPKKGLSEAGIAYAKWFIARLRLLDQTLSDGREFLCSGRFTIADIVVTYALWLGNNLGLDKRFGPYKPQTEAYMDRMMARPGFLAAREEEKASLQAWQEGRSKL